MDNLKIFNNIDYNLLHYDEKWIKNLYIESYNNIELNYTELNSFSELIMEKTKINLVITSGVKSTDVLEKFKSKMTKINSHIYVRKINNISLYYINQPSLYELIFLINKSKLCITCHGAPTHIASSFKVKTIDIIDNSKVRLYRSYTSHLKNYNEVIRENSRSTVEKIMNLL